MTTSATTAPSSPARRGNVPTHGGRLQTARIGWRRRLVLVLAMLITSVGGLTLAGAAPANAFARGCSFWNPFTVSGYSLAAGQYCAEVDGTGTYIYNVYGNFGSVGNVCNWDITAEFFDASWNWKRTYASAHNYGCTHAASASIYLPYYMSQLTGSNYGYMCSTLRVGWQRVTSVCHYIHP